jgi:glucokinase
MQYDVPTIEIGEARVPLFAGFDVGGTSIKIGIVDDNGATVGTTRIAMQAELPVDQTLQAMVAALSDVLDELGLVISDLSAIGLGTPGTMDIPAGTILEPPNLPGWRHFPVRDHVSQLCGDLPVAFSNDGNAAAFGEFWIGRGSQEQSIVMLTLGTGVGGGIIIDGVSLEGEHSHGAECGHIIVDTGPQARTCSCGQPGHLEAYASATAVVSRMRELLESGAESSLQPLLADDAGISALEIYQAAEHGDQLAQQVIQQTAQYLATGIVTLLHTIDVGAVVLGGAMDFGGQESESGRNFLAAIRQWVHEHTFPVIAEQVTIEFASLGGAAGYIGAAGLARKLVN